MDEIINIAENWWKNEKDCKFLQWGKAEPSSHDLNT